MQGCTAAATAQHVVVPTPPPASGHAGAQPREHDASSKFHDGRAAEASDDAPGEEYVVRVKAQVMKRDESTQMWLPTRGDPWSVVGLLRRRTRQRLGSGNGSAATAPASDHQGADGVGTTTTQQPQPAPSSRPSPGPVEYIIYARRVKDGQELINCRVEAEFYYCSANPLFHHWMAAAGERRHGLAFINARDASRFERHVRRAVADVKTGGTVGLSAEPSAEEVFSAVHLPSSSGPRRASPRDVPVPAAHGAAAMQLVRPVAVRSSGGAALSAALAQTPPAPQVHSQLQPVTKPLSPMLHHRPPLPPRVSGGGSVSERESAPLGKPSLVAPVLVARERDDGEVWVHRGDDGGEQESRGQGVVVRPPPPPTSATSTVTETTSLQDMKRRRQYSDYRKDYYVPADKPLVIRGYGDGAPTPLLSPPAVSATAVSGGVVVVGGDSQLLLLPPKAKSASPSSTVAPAGGAPLESASALSIVSGAADPKLPTKQKKKHPRLALRKLSGQQPLIAAARSGPQRCRNCHAVYHEANNPRGCCPEGTDPPMRFIERVTCAPCVDGIVYHCINDEDGGEEGLDAWSCSCTGGRRRRGVLKWALIALLGLVLPCVWCYPPLAACHRAARRSGVSGPRHASGGSSNGSNGGGGSSR